MIDNSSGVLAQLQDTFAPANGTVDPQIENGYISQAMLIIISKLQGSSWRAVAADLQQNISCHCAIQRHYLKKIPVFHCAIRLLLKGAHISNVPPPHIAYK